MGQSPFTKRPAAQDPGAARRRSTRVDFVAPVILSGRDVSTGQPFREQTKTSTVNLQGAKLETSQHVMVGMQVEVETAHSKGGRKAICVWVGEAQPGNPAHDIAVQLLNSGNIWGLESPPPDWETSAALGGPPGAPARESLVAKVPLRPSAPAPGAAPPPAPASGFSVDVQFAELEQRAAQLMESVLQITRKQADDIVESALRGFEQRLKELMSSAEARFSERAEKAYADFESSVQNLRVDLAEQLAARTEQVVETAEEALRSKVAELFSEALRPSTGAAQGKTARPPAKK